MTKGEKYKTDQERSQYFCKFCRLRICRTCEIEDVIVQGQSCIDAWLNLEHVEECDQSDNEAKKGSL